MSNGLNLLHPRKDVAELVIVFCVSLIVPKDLTFVIKSGKHVCHPYRSWEFHDSIKYQCPGVTVPKCRRFWRALIYIYIYMWETYTRKPTKLREKRFSWIQGEEQLPASNWVAVSWHSGRVDICWWYYAIPSLKLRWIPKMMGLGKGNSL